MPTSPINDLEAVRRRLRDVGTSLSVFGDDYDDALDDAVQEAVDEYSRDQERISIADVAGNGTSYYNVSSLTGWINEWSRVTRIEYPAYAVSTDHYPIYLDQTSDWRVYRDATIYYVWFPRHSPQTTETIRFWYVARHTLSEVSGTVTDTILTVHKRAVLDLAASYACISLATEAAQNLDSDLVADSVDWGQAQSRLKDMAAVWRTSYERQVVSSPSSSGPAYVLSDWGTRPRGENARRWATHSGRR